MQVVDGVLEIAKSDQNPRFTLLIPRAQKPHHSKSFNPKSHIRNEF